MRTTSVIAMAAALACGSVVLAGPAAADTTYISIAYAPSDGTIGEGTSTVSPEDAQARGIASCQEGGGSDCLWATWNHSPGCVVLVRAVDGPVWSGGHGDTVDDAVANAYDWAKEQGAPLPKNSTVARSLCAG